MDTLDRIADALQQGDDQLASRSSPPSALAAGTPAGDDPADRGSSPG